MHRGSQPRKQLIPLPFARGVTGRLGCFLHACGCGCPSCRHARSVVPPHALDPAPLSLACNPRVGDR